ncbi:hypothetical protein AAFF_G00262440 [Aldrovandia affinis]|uniref:Uncharacterized protein n=1 Tax=Aldrovandia affinis TaxID=143900 RepID=A0AAD7SSS8_9TELE|nr:hypothetical protein AAFF_G00262440 [Aldrovandia affinis]
MNKLGRNAWIGLGVGATAGIGLVLFLVMYKKMKLRICQRLSLPNKTDALALHSTDGPSTATVSHEMQAGSSLGTLALGLERGLSVEQQAELKNQLDEVLLCVAHLRGEVASLQGGLQDMAVQIVQDVKSGLEESQKTTRRRRHILSRERTDSMSSSSIYFNASAGIASHYDGESEAGYTTANAES